MNCLWPEYGNIPTLASPQYPAGPWRLPLLYGLGKAGETRVWQIGYDGNDSYHTVHGQLNGKLQSVNRKITLNKSGRGYPEQAYQECYKRYENKMIKENYSFNPNGLVQAKKPMCAVRSEVANISRYPVYVQPKLDGVRLLISLEANGIQYKTRNGRIMSFPHLTEQVSYLLSNLPRGSVLDGEFYYHGWSFDRITGAFKTIQGNQDTPLIPYHIYDYCDDSAPYDQRYQRLYQIFSQINFPSIRLIENHQVNDNDHVRQAFQYYLGLNYEGTMIRKVSMSGEPLDNTRYVYGRCSVSCSNLVKMKPFYDCEVQIVDVVSAQATEEGCAVFVVQWKDRQLRARPKGSHDDRRDWLADKNLLLGKMVTIEYDSLTEDGVPRFPRVKALRNYE